MYLSSVFPDQKQNFWKVFQLCNLCSILAQEQMKIAQKTVFCGKQGIFLSLITEGQTNKSLSVISLAGFW